MPCPHDFDALKEEGGSGSRVGVIIAIIILVALIIFVAVILIKREWREMCFRNFSPKTNIQYVDLEGKDHRTPPAIKREPVKTREIPYRQDTKSELNMNLQLAPDIPGVMEYEPTYKDPEPPPRPKPKVRKVKERTSLKDSFTDIDKYNAFNDKGKQDNENLVEINVEELLQQQKDAMRKEVKKHKETIRNKDGTTKRIPASRQKIPSRTENVAFTNDNVDTAPNIEPETRDNVLNEIQSRIQTPEPVPLDEAPKTLVVSSSSGRHRHHSGHSDKSRRDGRSSRGDRDRKRRHHGEKREHRRRKEGHLGDSMRSTDSTKSGRSERHRRKHSRSPCHGDASQDPKALLMTDITLNEFTSLEPIDELSGSLV